MKDAIELRGFMWLTDLFRERNWPNPYHFHITGKLTGEQLLAMLDIPKEKVEGIFVNGRVSPVQFTLINPGDRVALLPPGTPGPYRVLLGIRSIR
jgi:hypothetical protein